MLGHPLPEVRNFVGEFSTPNHVAQFFHVLRWFGSYAAPDKLQPGFIFIHDQNDDAILVVSATEFVVKKSLTGRCPAQDAASSWQAALSQLIRGLPFLSGIG